METAELWIRLDDGRTFCERYNQLEMAEFMRERMIGCVNQGEPIRCFDGEEIEIAARQVVGIDLIVTHESARRSTLA